MGMSSYCRNCGLPNATTAELSANHCNGCEEYRSAAITAFIENNPESNESERLYAGRMALGQRAHHPRETFVNPRDFNRSTKR